MAGSKTVTNKNIAFQSLDSCQGRHLYFRHRDAIIRKSTFWQNAETFIVAQSSEETRSERGFERSTLSPASL